MDIAKNIVINGFGAFNAYPGRASRVEDLRTLITALHPVTTDRDLIRVGPMGDGGYLVPDDLDGIEACFSPGVDRESRFEQDCARRGMQVFMADASVDGPAQSHPNFHFSKKFIGITTNERFMTLDAWVEASLPDSTGDLLLQIDIEGFEYETLIGTSDALMSRFRIIVAEFHELNLLFSQTFFKFASRAFEKLLQTHTCVHIHPNNCSGSARHGEFEIPRTMEFTFLRNDRIASRVPRRHFPDALDCHNTDLPPLSLPRCWYASQD